MKRVLRPVGRRLTQAAWDRLELDRFWTLRLLPSRQGTRWLDVLKTQVCYQLIEPGSEWRLYRHWYEHSALGDLLNSPARVIADDTLYRCLDKLLAHKRAFFSFLRERWETLFEARFDVLLYDLTSTYFESDPPFSGKRLTGEDPATLWRYYMQLTEIEQAFKELKHDLAIRPVFHQRGGERQNSGYKRAGIDVGGPGGWEPPRRLSGGDC